MCPNPHGPDFPWLPILWQQVLHELKAKEVLQIELRSGSIFLHTLLVFRIKRKTTTAESLSELLKDQSSEFTCNFLQPLQKHAEATGSQQLQSSPQDFILSSKFVYPETQGHYCGYFVCEAFHPAATVLQQIEPNPDKG